MNTAQTHYRALFDIEGNSDIDVDCTRIAKVVRKWITDREGAAAYKELGKSSFFIKGDWINLSNYNVHIHTISNKAPDAPLTVWSLRYEHPDRDHSCRRWIIDVTLQQISRKIVRFAMHVYFRIAPGYLGEDPPLPVPSIPRLIPAILDEENIIAKAGDYEFKTEFTTVMKPDAIYFAEEITAPNRLMPYVVIAENMEGSALIDPIHLAKQLAGNARVFLLKQETQNRFNDAVGYHLRCGTGMVRVYQPHATNDEHDARRHRFFLEDHIRIAKPDNVVMQLIIGLVRRGKVYLDRRPISREDVEAEITRTRLRQLKMKLFEGAPNKQISELADTFEKLLSEVDKERDNALSECEYYQNQLELIQSELDQEKQKLFAKDQQIALMQKKAKQGEETLRQLDAYKNLDELPQSISEVLHVLSKTHGVILEFTQEAYKSAADAEFTDVSSLWNALCRLSKTLSDLAFEQNSESIETEFKRLTGLELSFNEGKMTKRDKKFAHQRLIHHNGQEYDITPHLKLHKSGKYLRIHFALDRKNKKIIIGHCGDHLDTYGTRRLS